MTTFDLDEPHIFRMERSHTSTSSMTEPSLPFQDGFIDDESARDYEAHERPYEFLITGRPPAVGQRMQSYVDLLANSSSDHGGWCRFSGIVTHVGEEPSLDQWVATSFWTDGYRSSGASGDDSVFRFDNDCTECGTGEPACWLCKIMGGEKSRLLTSSELKTRCKAVMGALHNQTITTYAYAKLFDDPEATLPYSVGRIYKMSFKLDDSKVIPWCVTSIEDVTDVEPKDLPEVFKDWEAGRKEGMVAPYDLPTKERKKHALEIQHFLTALKAEHERMDY